MARFLYRRFLGGGEAEIRNFPARMSVPGRNHTGAMDGCDEQLMKFLRDVLSRRE